MTKRVGSSVVVAAMMLLSGCSGFFISNSSSGTVTSTTGDYLYAVNPTTNAIDEYTLASGSLTAITGSPVTAPTGLVATSITVSRANTFVYVGGLGTISSYTIGSNGALTLASATAASYQGTDFVSLDTSPDGQWLLALEANSFTVYVFKINTSTGALVQTSTAPYIPPASASPSARMLRISSTGLFVATALGPGGDGFFSFNTNTGVINYIGNVSLASGFSDNAVQFDGSGSYLFAARGATTTGASLIAQYAIGTNGALTTGPTVASGNAPYALLLEYSGGYLYAANRLDGTLSGDTVTTGVLAAIAGSPYPSGASGSTPTALAEDNTHKYVVAASSAGNADLTLFSLDVLTPGKLDAVATATSGAAGLSNLAATH
jgi:6-phosphogluconolactonase (cycloisomerase 2 family)